MEPAPLFFTVVLACTLTSLLMAVAAYLFYRVHERRTTGTPRRPAKAASKPAPVRPRARAPVMTAPPVPAQMYTPPKEMPKAETMPKEAETTEQGRTAETTERAETVTEAETIETETLETETTEAETIETETIETETLETETTEAETTEAETTEVEERASALPEPFFREYMGPGQLVPVRTSKGTRDGNDDEFVWL
ncbi:hypothetical protein [Rhodocaloribacter sp.]